MSNQQPSKDNEAVAGNAADDDENPALAALQRLDEHYESLQAKEDLLKNTLVKLKHDETCLCAAMEESDTRTPMQKRMEKEAEVVQRLEQALLGSSSSEDEGSSDDNA